MTTQFTRVSLAATWLLMTPAVASAQLYESVGIRAQGMGGAFVAVANDATATWWNPAGLASGSYFSLLFERGHSTEPGEPGAAGPARRERATAFAVAVPSLGLSYYRLRISEIGPLPSTGSGGVDRNTEGVVLRARAVSQYGITVGQSLSDALVVASTLKLLRAGETQATSLVGPGVLERTEELPVSVDTKADLDVGAMLVVRSAKIGVAVKHLGEPEFEGENGLFVLKRQVRVGAAFTAGAVPGQLRGLTVAFDADLTETPTANGDVRHLAGGLEGWLGEWVGLRGGVSVNTVGDARTAWSAGVSLGPGGGVFLDAAATFGSDASKEGWNVGARLTF